MSNSILEQGSHVFLTENLRLRRFKDGDFDDLLSMHKNDKVRELLLDDFPLDQPMYAYAFIQRQKQIYEEYPGLGIWCAEKFTNENSVEALTTDNDHDDLNLDPHGSVQLKANFAGWFNLLPMPENNSDIELGSRLLPRYWGSGIAIEGGELLINYAFGELGYQSLWIVSHPSHRSVDYIAHVLGFHSNAVREYCGQEARYYLLYSSHWDEWKTIPLKVRKRMVIKQTKEPL